MCSSSPIVLLFLLWAKIAEIVFPYTCTYSFLYGLLPNYLHTFVENKLTVYENYFGPLMLVCWYQCCYLDYYSLSIYLDRIILHSLVCHVTSLTMSYKLTWTLTLLPSKDWGHRHVLLYPAPMLPVLWVAEFCVAVLKLLRIIIICHCIDI